MVIYTPFFTVLTSYVMPSALAIAWRVTVDAALPIGLVWLCDLAWFGESKRPARRRIIAMWIAGAALYVTAFGRAEIEAIGRLTVVLLAFHAVGLGARLAPQRLLAWRALVILGLVALGLSAALLFSRLGASHADGFGIPRYDDLGAIAALLWGLALALLLGAPVALALRAGGSRRPAPWPLIEAGLVSYPFVFGTAAFALAGSRSLFIEYGLFPMISDLTRLSPVFVLAGYGSACFRFSDALAAGESRKAAAAVAVALAAGVMCFIAFWYSGHLWTPSRYLG